MVARLRDAGSDASPKVTVHLALAMIMSPLLFIKVLIARYYKNQHGLLMPIGLTIFVLQASSKGLYLFPGMKEGTSPTDIKKAFNAACDRAGIKDFRFHDLRHTFGTRAADAGESLTNIADVMGRANIHTTMR